MTDEAVAEPVTIFQDAQLSEVLFCEHATRAPLAVAYVEYCGQYIADLHSRTSGLIPDVGLYVFEDCFVCFGGLVLSKDKRIFDSPGLMSPYWRKLVSEKIKSRNPKDPVYKFIAQAADTAIKEFPNRSYVLLIKPGSSVYGHWLLDILPMIWLYKRSRHFDPTTKYLISSLTPEWVFLMIEAVFGLQEDMFVKFNDSADIAHCGTVIVPSLLRVSPCISTDYNLFADDVITACSKIGNASEPPPKRLYISRGGVMPTASIKRYLSGEDEIEACASSRGFAVVRPEKMPWHEQVRMFAGAEMIMGEFGSGLHNTVFSPPGALNVVLSNSMMTWTQSAISAMREQPLQYIKPASELRVGNQIDCSYDVEIIGRCLDALIASR